MTPRIAAATADLGSGGLNLEGGDPDRPHLEAAFEGRAELAFPRWDEAGVRWDTFDLVLVRSTWDYTGRLGEFLLWIDRTAASTRLLNDPATVRWNSDKTYLGALGEAGVPIVPTAYATDPDGVRALLRAHAEERAGEVVVKPSVSAGSHLTGRFTPDDPAAADLGVQILSAGKSVMIQPFVPSVADRGEVAVLFFEGRPSHAVRKGPLLASGGGLLAGSYVEELQAVPLEGPCLDAATRVLEAHATIRPSSDLLYARVDLVEADDGTFQLLELELIEPSLFLPQAPDAADRFADAVLGRLAAR